MYSIIQFFLLQESFNKLFYQTSWEIFEKEWPWKIASVFALLTCILLIINDQFPRNWFINLYPLPLAVRGASEPPFLIWNRPRYGNRTFADVIVSCFKIVIGFYQVISGIFTALARVKWSLIPMEKFLKVVERSIFQFAPLSCISIIKCD